MELIQKSNKLEKSIVPSAKLKKILDVYNVDYHDLDLTSLEQLRKDYTKQGFKDLILTEIRNLSPLDKGEIALIEIDKSGYDSIKEQREEAEQIEKEKTEEKLTREYNKKLKEIKTNKTPNIDKITWIIEDFIKLTLNNKTDKHSLIIKGVAGIGKTYLVKKVLRKLFNTEELKNIIRNGHISPLSYYNLLYDNPEGTFFFDDVSGLEQSDAGISLLKQTTESEKDRFVCYSSTTGKLENRIPYFFFKGSQIFCFNRSPKSKKFQPIFSRIRAIEFNPTYKEILVMMYEIIKYRWKDIDLKQKIKIVEFIERNSSESVKNFDLRLLNDIIDVYVYCDGINGKFKQMCGKIIEIDKEKELVLSLIKSKMPLAEKIAKFQEETNRSSRQYYRLKKALDI